MGGRGIACASSPWPVAAPGTRPWSAPGGSRCSSTRACRRGRWSAASGSSASPPASWPPSFSRLSTPHTSPPPGSLPPPSGGEPEGGLACLPPDLGHVPLGLRDCIRAADLVILEANHDRRRLLAGPY